MTIPGLTRAVAAEVVGVVRLPKGVDHTSSPVQVYRAMVDRCRRAASRCVSRVQSGKPYRWTYRGPGSTARSTATTR